MNYEGCAAIETNELTIAWRINGHNCLVWDTTDRQPVVLRVYHRNTLIG